MPTLICKRITFFSPNDELHFFEWLGKISCVKQINGRGDLIELKIPRRRISEANLRELIALFYRYGVEIKQLDQFSTPKNQSWFKNRQSYWNRSVCGQR